MRTKWERVQMKKTFNIRKSPNIILKLGMQSFHIDHASRTSYNLNQVKGARGKPNFEL